MKKLFLIILGLALVSSGFSGCKKSQRITAEASIYFYSGDVTINGSAVTETGIKIKYGDAISTGTKTICKIKIDDKTMLQMKDNTVLIYKISRNESVLQIDSGWLAGSAWEISSR